MKIAICNVPLKTDAAKTNYPPLGALAIVQSLRAAGYDPAFYDVNFLRPSDEEMREYFAQNGFEAVGISAAVSTSYGFVKRMAGIVRSVLPQAAIIIGGRMATSAEVILKRMPVDFCVIGEGENIVRNLADYLARYGNRKEESVLAGIKGLCFTGPAGDPVFTGYDAQPSVDEIRDPDYAILERFSNVGNYITDPFIYEQFKYDARSFEPRRRGKRLATAVTSRGCINRCSFCHRWQPGVRIFPVDRVIGHVKELIDRYNVGFVSFGDENFGATRTWIDEFIEKITPLDILYRVGGVCCDSIDVDILRRLKKSGCVAVHYGFESGSGNMLKVMEKRSDVATNVRAALWTHESGLQTVPALVVGMPGENFRTIRETSDFVNRITERLPRPPILSINALITLPGTPVYEYARLKGLLGTTVDDEERYLLKISNKGGASFLQLNLTDYPYFIVQGWIRCISWAAHYNYRVKNGLPLFPTRKLFGSGVRYLVRGAKAADPASESVLSNRLLFRLRHMIAPLFVMYKNLREDKSSFFKRCIELFAWPFRKKRFTAYVPLRAVIQKEIGALPPGDVRMLRLGR